MKYNLGLAEVVLYLLVIATAIQYCINWARYLEWKFTVAWTMTSFVSWKKSKLKKTGGSKMDELVEEAAKAGSFLVGPPPTWSDTLPCQMWRAMVAIGRTFLDLPRIVREVRRVLARLDEDEAREQAEVQEEKRAREDNKVRMKEAKAKWKNA